jgi:hypothetical protein
MGCRRISAAEDGKFIFGGKWLEMDKKGIYKGIDSRVAGVYMGSNYDLFRLIRRVCGQIFLRGIHKILPGRIGSKKMVLTQTAIWQIGQREGQQNRKHNNKGPEFLESSSHIKLREPSAFTRWRNP